MKITIERARELAIACQGLDGSWQLAQGRDGAAQVVERLGYVQIDTIAVVQRAHHHILWARHAGYEPEMIWELQRERRVFEYWASQASFVPMADYRYYLPAMRRWAKRWRRGHWLGENTQVIEHVLARIREEGALAASDFQAPEGFQRGAWWNWKPAKRALEELFGMGVLMVSERRGFQRVYDLAERVVPPDTDTRMPTDDEVRAFKLRRLLRNHGVFALTGMFVRKARQDYERLIDPMVKSGEVQPVEIADWDDVPRYGLTEILEGEVASSDRPALHILSPFDPLATDRDRLERLYGFQYRLECYVPAAKRQSGYFSLPILQGTRFVGRVDCKADRKLKRLIVRNLVMEPDAEISPELVAALAARLGDFACFNVCDQIAVEGVDPPKLKEPLERALAASRPTEKE